MRLKFAGYQSENSVHTRAGRLFARRVSELCPEVEDVSVLADVTKTGRGSWDLRDMVANGEIDFCYFSTGGFAANIPALGVIDLPFIVHDRARAFAVLDGPTGQRIVKDIETLSPFRFLGFWDNGIRHISNRSRPIRTPADSRGLRMRTLNNKLYLEMMSAVGFETMTTDAAFLKKICASGEVDCQENPLTNILHFGLWECHPHVTMTAHIFGAGLFIANRATFATWPRPAQDAVMVAAREATLANRRYAADEDAICRVELEKKGTQFVDLTPEERARFRDAVADVVRPYREALDPAVVKAYLGAQAG